MNMGSLQATVPVTKDEHKSLDVRGAGRKKRWGRLPQSGKVLRGRNVTSSIRRWHVLWIRQLFARLRSRRVLDVADADGPPSWNGFAVDSRLVERLEFVFGARAEQLRGFSGRIFL